jgi:hypothetical protein
LVKNKYIKSGARIETLKIIITLRSPPNNIKNKIENTETTGIPKVGKANIINKIKAKIIIILTKYLFSIKIVFSKKPVVKFLIKIPTPINTKIYEINLG